MTPTDRADDYRALTTGCALRLPAERAFAELAGADRARFLHGLVTCDVKGLVPGTGGYGFFTSPKGRILADVVVLAGEESLGLDLPAEAAGGILEHLGRYIVADRVEPRERPELAPVALAGPGAEELAAELGLAPPAGAWAHRRAELDGVGVRVVRHLPSPVAHLTLWVETERRDELAAALLERGAAAGLSAVGDAAWDALRVERGAPRFGLDFGPEHLPQETGLGHAIDFEKGCYLGQEVVARIHYRGKVNRSLCGLLLGDGELPTAGTELMLEGAVVGTVGTAAACPGLGRNAALGTVHRKAAAPGTRVEVGAEGGGEAEVVGLPLG